MLSFQGCFKSKKAGWKCNDFLKLSFFIFPVISTVVYHILLPAVTSRRLVSRFPLPTSRRLVTRNNVPSHWQEILRLKAYGKVYAKIWISFLSFDFSRSNFVAYGLQVAEAQTFTFRLQLWLVKRFYLSKVLSQHVV